MEMETMAFGMDVVCCVQSVVQCAWAEMGGRDGG
jgi:hypothetical protein